MGSGVGSTGMGDAGAGVTVPATMTTARSVSLRAGSGSGPPLQANDAHRKTPAKHLNPVHNNCRVTAHSPRRQSRPNQFPWHGGSCRRSQRQAVAASHHSQPWPVAPNLAGQMIALCNSRCSGATRPLPRQTPTCLQRLEPLTVVRATDWSRSSGVAKKRRRRQPPTTDRLIFTFGQPYAFQQRLTWRRFRFARTGSASGHENALRGRFRTKPGHSGRITLHLFCHQPTRRGSPNQR